MSEERFRENPCPVCGQPKDAGDELCPSCERHEGERLAGVARFALRFGRRLIDRRMAS